MTLKEFREATKDEDENLKIYVEDDESNHCLESKSTEVIEVFEQTELKSKAILLRVLSDD